MHGTRMLRARSKQAAFLIVALLLVLVGCGGGPTEVATQPTEPIAAPTDTAEPTAVPTQEPTDIPTEPPPTEAPPTDTPVPTEEPTPEPIDDSACIGCHSSEEALRAMATEEEAPEVESEGEG